MEENVANLVLKELREFRQENDKRFTKLEEKMTNMEDRMTSIEDRMTNIENRTTQLENGRIEDRKDILDVLDTMQKSITERFDELTKMIDAKFEKIGVEKNVREREQQIIKEKIDGHEKRLNFYNSRIEYLEKWRDDIENGGLYMV